MEDKVTKIYNILKDLLDYTSMSVRLKENNKLHVFIDCFGEFDLTIEENSITLYEG